MWFAENKSWSEYRRSLGGFSAIVCKDGSTVWAEDASGKTIASGEAGVDDASVIQSAVNAAPTDSRIVVKGKFTIDKKITIDKILTITNGWFVCTTSPAIEIFDGDTSGSNPDKVTFIDCRFEGDGTNDILKFRYCSNWQIISCKIWNCSRAIVLERTWGDASLLFTSIIDATPPDNDGAISCITPENDNTNSFTVAHTSIRIRNNNAFCIYCHPQASGRVHNILIHDVQHEQEGCFLGGICTNIKIRDCGLHGLAGSLKLDDAGALDIKGGILSNIYLSWCEKVFVRTNLEAKMQDKPLLEIGGGRDILIEKPVFRGLVVNEGVPYFKIGAEYNCENFVIDGGIVVGGGAGAFLETEANTVHKRCFVRNVLFYSFNGNSRYSTCYIHKTNGRQVYFENCCFLETDYCSLTDYLPATLLRDCIGEYLDRNSDTATFSGDGTTTQFSIAHGLVSAPQKVLVTPMTADAASDFYVTADDTNIYINYKSAPPSGTDNLKLSWYAEV